MTVAQLPNAELLKMIDKMAKEISSLKADLDVATDLVRANEWALLIARDEAQVNADLLAKATKRAELRIVNTETPVYFLPFATDEADECTKISAPVKPSETYMEAVVRNNLNTEFKGRS